MLTDGAVVVVRMQFAACYWQGHPIPSLPSPPGPIRGCGKNAHPLSLRLMTCITLRYLHLSAV